MKTFIQKMAAVMAALFFIQGVVLVHAAETNFWKDRKLAALPKTTPVAPIIPVDKMSLTDLGLDKSQFSSSIIPAWMNAAITPYATIQAVHQSPNSKSQTIILLQDAHLHFEAQTNIAGVIDQVARGLEQRSSGLLVGMEGLDIEEADFTPYNQIPERKILRDVAEALLKENVLNGIEFAGMGYQGHGENGPVQLPFKVIGVEKQSEYDANVNALKASRPIQNQFKDNLAKYKRFLVELKKQHFNEDLKKFAAKLSDFNEGTLGLPEYMLYLDSLVAASGSHSRDLIEATLLEGAIDFAKVERERERLIEKLVQKLSDTSIQNLLQLSSYYQSGQVSYGDYYGHLKSLCKSNGVNLAQFPEMGLYIQYVLKSEAIDAQLLFKEIRALENNVRAKLARTPQQKEILEMQTDYYLMVKLSNHELTEDEWHLYSSRKDRQAFWNDYEFPIYIEDLGAHGEVLEMFYNSAIARNDTMVEKLSKKLAKSNMDTGLLVVGGFHTQGIVNGFKEKGFNVITLSPKITEIGDGLTSLDILATNRLPLDQIFVGERLFLPVPSQTQSPTGLSIVPHMMRSAVQVLKAPGKNDTATDGPVKAVENPEPSNTKGLFITLGNSTRILFSAAIAGGLLLGDASLLEAAVVFEGSGGSNTGSAYSPGPVMTVLGFLALLYMLYKVAATRSVLNQDLRRSGKLLQPDTRLVLIFSMAALGTIIVINLLRVIGIDIYSLFAATGILGAITTTLDPKRMAIWNLLAPIARKAGITNTTFNKMIEGISDENLTTFENEFSQKEHPQSEKSNPVSGKTLSVILLFMLPVLTGAATPVPMAIINVRVLVAVLVGIPVGIYLLSKLFNAPKNIALANSKRADPFVGLALIFDTLLLLPVIFLLYVLFGDTLGLPALSTLFSLVVVGMSSDPGFLRNLLKSLFGQAAEPVIPAQKLDEIVDEIDDDSIGIAFDKIPKGPPAIDEETDLPFPYQNYSGTLDAKRKLTRKRLSQLLFQGKEPTIHYNLKENWPDLVKDLKALQSAFIRESFFIYETDKISESIQILERLIASTQGTSVNDIYEPNEEERYQFGLGIAIFHNSNPGYVQNWVEQHGENHEQLSIIFNELIKDSKSPKFKAPKKSGDITGTVSALMQETLSGGAEGATIQPDALAATVKSMPKKILEGFLNVAQGNNIINPNNGVVNPYKTPTQEEAMLNTILFFENRKIPLRTAPADLKQQWAKLSEELAKLNDRFDADELGLVISLLEILIDTNDVPAIAYAYTKRDQIPKERAGEDKQAEHERKVAAEMFDLRIAIAKNLQIFRLSIKQNNPEWYTEFQKTGKKDYPLLSFISSQFEKDEKSPNTWGGKRWPFQGIASAILVVVIPTITGAASPDGNFDPMVLLATMIGLVLLTFAGLFTRRYATQIKKFFNQYYGILLMSGLGFTVAFTPVEMGIGFTIGLVAGFILYEELTKREFITKNVPISAFLSVSVAAGLAVSHFFGMTPLLTIGGAGFLWIAGPILTAPEQSTRKEIQTLLGNNFDITIDDVFDDFNEDKGDDTTSASFFDDNVANVLANYIIANSPVRYFYLGSNQNYQDIQHILTTIRVHNFDERPWFDKILYYALPFVLFFPVLNTYMLTKALEVAIKGRESSAITDLFADILIAAGLLDEQSSIETGIYSAAHEAARPYNIRTLEIIFGRSGNNLAAKNRRAIFGQTVSENGGSKRTLTIVIDQEAVTQEAIQLQRAYNKKGVDIDLEEARMIITKAAVHHEILELFYNIPHQELVDAGLGSVNDLVQQDPLSLPILVDQIDNRAAMLVHNKLNSFLGRKKQVSREEYRRAEKDEKYIRAALGTTFKALPVLRKYLPKAKKKSLKYSLGGVLFSADNSPLRINSNEVSQIATALSNGKDKDGQTIKRFKKAVDNALAWTGSTVKKSLASGFKLKKVTVEAVDYNSLGRDPGVVADILKKSGELPVILTTREDFTASVVEEIENIKKEGRNIEEPNSPEAQILFQKATDLDNILKALHSGQGLFLDDVYPNENYYLDLVALDQELDARALMPAILDKLGINPNSGTQNILLLTNRNVDWGNLTDVYTNLIFNLIQVFPVEVTEDGVNGKVTEYLYSLIQA